MSNKDDKIECRTARNDDIRFQVEAPDLGVQAAVYELVGKMEGRR